MREIVETGTDVAAVGAGDPSLLRELRACKGRKYESARDAAVAAGAYWRSELDADGAYLFHIFVDEPPSPSLADFLMDPITVEPFRVPSGRLLVAGEECFVGALNPADYPNMGREIGVPAGDYTLTAFRVEAPDDLYDLHFARVATPEQRRAWSLGNSLPAICVFLTIGALVAAYFLYLQTVSVLVALLPLLASLLAWLGQAQYRRTETFRSAEQAFRAIELELPSIAIVMRAQRPLG